jgi:hypothetical protein
VSGELLKGVISALGVDAGELMQGLKPPKGI